MKKSPLVLAIAVLLFCGWLIYLGVTALNNKSPVVVSRAQLASSQYDIEVELTPSADGIPQKVTVRKVIWAADANPPAGEITVTNLPSAQGYVGPGSYILPLIRRGNDYEVADVPSNLDPGNPMHAAMPARIYPDTPEVAKQWEQIRGNR